MQPIQHLLLLRNPRPFLLIVLPNVMFSNGDGLPVFGIGLIIRSDEARADEQYVPNPDVAALSLRPDVDALVFAAEVELLVWDTVVDEA